jgi:outer membrane protein
VTDTSTTNRKSLLAAILAAALGTIVSAVQAGDLVIPVELPEPNFLGLGVGAYPDYFGSSDYKVGAAPIGRLSLGGSRFVRLMANEVHLNLLDHPNWQLGPVGLWRFGREDVENPVVDRVHHIDDSIDLGLFGGYKWQDAQEFRRMAGVSAWPLGMSAVSTMAGRRGSTPTPRNPSRRW